MNNKRRQTSLYPVIKLILLIAHTKGKEYVRQTSTSNVSEYLSLSSSAAATTSSPTGQTVSQSVTFRCVKRANERRSR